MICAEPCRAFLRYSLNPVKDATSESGGGWPLDQGPRQLTQTTSQDTPENCSGFKNWLLLRRKGVGHMLPTCCKLGTLSTSSHFFFVSSVGVERSLVDYSLWSLKE